MSSHIQKQIEDKIQKLESVFEKPMASTEATEPNDSTIESSKEASNDVRKVSDFLNLCIGEAISNYAMQPLTTCASVSNSLVASAQDFSEPIAPSKLFFPAETQVTKMARLLDNSEKISENL